MHFGVVHTNSSHYRASLSYYYRNPYPHVMLPILQRIDILRRNIGWLLSIFAVYTCGTRGERAKIIDFLLGSSMALRLARPADTANARTHGSRIPRGIKRNPFSCLPSRPTESPRPYSLPVDEKLPAVALCEISDSRMEVANVINGTVN